MKITVHCLVKNEDRWIWFALKSVLPYVERIILYDTGSTDQTVDVIKTLKNDKIELEEKGEVSKIELIKLRQEMIDKTKTEWFLILDGDEIWPEISITETINVAKNAPRNVVAIFNPVKNCIGDIFHYLPEDSGKYQIKGKVGNFNIRLIRKNDTMKVEGEYPLEVYLDKNGPIQNQEENLLYVDKWFLHTSFLERSSEDSKKVSGSFGKSRVWQYGVSVKKGELPKVIFQEFPKIVPNPLEERGFIYNVSSLILYPLVYLKRKIL